MNENAACRGGCDADIDQNDIDPVHFRKIQSHPCFNREASHRYGRIHLPVAPDCNIQCNYCLREFDCVNESRPGVTSQVLEPLEALQRVKEVMARFDNIRTIGIAGPGEPLANEATFETFKLVKERFQGLNLCVSSNGLALPERLSAMVDLGIDTLTVTMNAVDPATGSRVYSWVLDGNHYHRDIEGAELLLSRQIAGIRAAVENGIIVKINTVMIPGINDHCMLDIAKKAGEMGAFIQNIMPLIPKYKFADVKPPTPVQRKEAQRASAKYVRQMTHCRQCRADAIGLLGQDISPDRLSEINIGSRKDGSTTAKVAVAGKAGNGIVDCHFGHADRFQTYDIDGD